MGDETYYRGSRWFVPSWEPAVTWKCANNISRETLPEDILYKCIFIYCYLYHSGHQNLASDLYYKFNWDGANPVIIKTWLHKHLYITDRPVLNTALKILNGKAFYYSSSVYRGEPFMGTIFLGRFVDKYNIPLDTLVQIADI